MKTSKITLATVMTTAWTIAKEAAKKFGGSARQYLAGALKAAWVSIKTPKEIQSSLNKKQFKKTTERGTEIIIDIEWGMVDSSIYADGDEIENLEYFEVFNIVIKKQNGEIFAKSRDINFVKELMTPKNGFVARVGDTFIQQANWDLIKPMIDEAKSYFKPTKAFTYVAETHGAGWCNRCESYCWGDCSAS